MNKRKFLMSTFVFFVCTFFCCANVYAEESKGELESRENPTSVLSDSEVTDETRANVETQIAAGWYKDENGNWYYYDDYGNCYTGYYQIDDNYYYFDDLGIMQTGWQHVYGEETVYYFGQDGAAYHGIKTIAGITYYFYDGGQLATSGWDGITTTRDDGYLIAFNNEGIVQDYKVIEANKWIQLLDNYYYFDADLNPYYGVHEINGIKYYFDHNGCLATFIGDENRTAQDGNYLISYNNRGEVIDYVEIVGNKWILFNGGYYYYDANLNPYRGVHEINGVRYYFEYDGRLATSEYDGIWTTEYDGYLVAYNNQGVVVDYDKKEGNKWISFNGYYYYYDADLNPYSGVREINGVKYYFEYGGRLATSELDIINTTEDNGYLVAYNNKGEVVDYKKIEGNKWILFNGNYYYYDADLNPYFGVHEINGVRYYFEYGGRLATYNEDHDRMIQDGNYLIAYNNQGIVIDYVEIVGNRWISFNGGYYYYDTNLNPYRGVHEINGVRYYFEYDGRLSTSEYDGIWITEDDGYLIAYNNQGVVVDYDKKEGNKWILFNGDYYYYDSDLNPYVGVREVNGKNYYFYDNGQLATFNWDGISTTQDNGYLIAFNNKGEVIDYAKIIANQWIYFYENYYYFDDYLEPYTGVRNIGGTYYYFYSNGCLATTDWDGIETTEDENYLISYDHDGVVIEYVQKLPEQWIYFNGHKYYYDADLNPYSGVREIDGVKYYFYGNGCLATADWDEDIRIFENGEYLVAVDNYGVVVDQKKKVPNQWIEIYGQWYLFDSKLNPYYGVQEINGTRYYFEYDGRLATYDGYGITTTQDDGYLIAYNNQGVVVEYEKIEANKWIEFDGDWYYFDDNLNPYYGVHEIDGTKYYFDWSGCLASYEGTTEHNGYLIAYNDKGVVVEEKKIIANQWIEFKGDWYYYDTNLNPYTGVHVINGTRYYFEYDGRLATSDYAHIETTEEDGYLVAYNAKGVVTEYKQIVGNQWISFNGDWYYYDDDLNPYSGVQEINGVLYYFYYDGQLATHDYNSNDVYNDTDAFYIVDKNGVVTIVKKVEKQWMKVDNDWYYFGENLSTINGFYIINGVTYYFDGSQMQTGIVYEESDRYFFDEQGHMVTGWYQELDSIEKNWLYFDSDGKAADGWRFNNKYYIRRGYMLIGKQIIDNKLCVFGTDGILRDSKTLTKGWLAVDGAWFYYNGTRLLENEWATINGKTYYFDYNGEMATSKIVDEYVLDENGYWVFNQWVKVTEDYGYSFYTYADENGRAIEFGWKLINNVWYHFDYYMMDTQNTLIDGKINLFNSNGQWLGVSPVKNGWVAADGSWYYLINGQFTKGWKKIDGSWYYFDEDTGRAYEDETRYIDGKCYLFDGSARLASGWVKHRYGDYSYANAQGIAQEGWQKIDNVWYYFSEYGCYMVTGLREIDGKYYFFKDSGAWDNKTVSTSTGWHQFDGKWYYAENNEYLIDQWKVINGKYYFFGNYEMYSNIFVSVDVPFSNGSKYMYYFNADGTLAVNQKVVYNGKTYYTDENGYFVV